MLNDTVGERAGITLSLFDRLESGVRTYSRLFPAIFSKATGSYLYDTDGRRYLDFFCGAGALNYGHNEPRMKSALIEFLQYDGIVHSLDMATQAKAEFLRRFESTILGPRSMSHRVQFTGPTGADAVEAALKIARKHTGRSNVVAFTNAYHGASLGALAATAHGRLRHQSFRYPADVTFMPYDGYMGTDTNTLDYLGKALEDKNSGLDLPAAVILETVQAEGGIRIASNQWLAELQSLCRHFGILLVVDDIQAGCGRTGPFFSFERANLDPDIVVLSKSLSGFGLPLSVVLIRPEVDCLKPGEHPGTFRGNNLAFVTASSALDFWETNDNRATTESIASYAACLLKEMVGRWPSLQLEVRQAGLMIGVEIGRGEEGAASLVAQECFNRGLLLEACGSQGTVLKLLPALNIPPESIAEGIHILSESIGSIT